MARAISPPVAIAVAVAPVTVAVRKARKGMTAALVEAMKKTPKYRTPQFVTAARSTYLESGTCSAPFEPRRKKDSLLPSHDEGETCKDVHRTLPNAIRVPTVTDDDKEGELNANQQSEAVPSDEKLSSKRLTTLGGTPIS